MYSKIERGDRKAKCEQVVKLAELLQVDSEELLILWLADQITTVVANEKKIADKALDIAKQELTK